MYKKINNKISEKLKNIVSKENIFTEQDDIEKYARDENPGAYYLPEVVVRPSKSRQIEELVNFANKNDMLNLLEAAFVIQSNDQFHRISDKVKEEVGALDSKKIFFEWNEWLKRAAKKIRMK